MPDIFFGLPGNCVWKSAVGVGPVDTLGWEEWVRVLVDNLG